jgi:hypothetical protein
MYPEVEVHIHLAKSSERGSSTYQPSLDEVRYRRSVHVVLAETDWFSSFLITTLFESSSTYIVLAQICVTACG